MKNKPKQKAYSDKKSGQMVATPGNAIVMTPKKGTGAARKDKDMSTGGKIPVKVKNAANGVYIPKPTSPVKPAAAKTASKPKYKPGNSKKAFSNVKKAHGRQNRGGLKKC